MTNHVRLLVAFLAALCVLGITACDRQPERGVGTKVSDPGDAPPKEPEGTAAQPAGKQAPRAASKPSGDATTLMAQLDDAIATYRAADHSNVLKMKAAAGVFDARLAQIKKDWIEKEISIAMRVSTVREDVVVLAACIGHEPKLLIGGEWPFDKVAAAFSMNARDLIGEDSDAAIGAIGIAQFPRDVNTTQAAKWTKGDSVPLVVRIVGITKLEADHDLGGMTRSLYMHPGAPAVHVVKGGFAGSYVAVFATWTTSDDTYFDGIDPSRRAAGAEQERIRHIVEVVTKVREWQARVTAELAKPAFTRSVFATLAAQGKMKELDELLGEGRSGAPKRYWAPTRAGLREGEFDVDALGWNALHAAAFSGTDDVVKALVKTHFNPGDHTGARMGVLGVAFDPPGELQRSVTALHLAAMQGHTENVKGLLPSAMPTHAPWRNKPENDLQQRFKHTSPYRPESANEFLDDKNPFRAVGAAKYTRATWAPELDAKDTPGDPPIKAVPYAINEPDIDGLTALDYARIFGQTAVEKVLVEAGAKGVLDPKELPSIPTP